jgi:N-acetylmuramoyl-L-alanine amidase
MSQIKLRKSRADKIKTTVGILFLLIISHSVFSQEYQTDKAQPGDGIYTILKRNGLNPSQYMNDFIELNKAHLGKDNTLITGKTYRLPLSGPVAEKTIDPNTDKAPLPASAPDKGAKKTISVPLFGEANKEVTVKDQELNGAVFYLKSGHGGPDPGAMGSLNGHTLCEDEYAYDVTIRLAKVLMEHGADVQMIVQDPDDGIRNEKYLAPDKDEVCFPNLKIPRNQLSRLRQRTDAINDLYAKNKGKFQRLVVIHVDSRAHGQNIDVFFYHDPESKAGQKLANTLQQTFRQKYDRFQPNRGYQGSVSPRNLYVLKYSYPTSVFIELGNINHYRDQQRLIIPDNRQALANWLAEGLIKDYKNCK